MRSRRLIGLGAGALLLTPTLAHSQATTISARDTPAWAPANVTVTVGERVTFESRGNNLQHYLQFTGDAKPDCDAGVPMSYPPPDEWSGTCTFATAGSYPFRCPLHDGGPYSMNGVVRVVATAPTPTPTPTAGGSPTPPPEPGATPAPTPVGTQTPAAQRTLPVRLPRRQRGTRVRGRVEVLQAGSRLVVTLTARRKRVGRMVRKSTPAGRVAFSVRLNKRGRRALHNRRRLAVKVRVALTPPAAPKLTRTRRVKLRR